MEKKGTSSSLLDQLKNFHRIIGVSDEFPEWLV
jgi:hypothetical protein